MVRLETNRSSEVDDKAGHDRQRTVCIREHSKRPTLEEANKHAPICHSSRVGPVSSHVERQLFGKVFGTHHESALIVLKTRRCNSASVEP